MQDARIPIMDEDVIVRQGKVVCALFGKSAFEERHIDAPIIVPLNVCRNYQYIQWQMPSPL